MSSSRGQAPAMSEHEGDDWSSSAEGRRGGEESAATNEDIELATGGPSQQQEKQQHKQNQKRLLKSDSRVGPLHHINKHPVPEAGIGSFFTNIAELTKDFLDMDEASSRTDAEMLNTEGFVVSLLQDKTKNSRHTMEKKMVET